jgi:hypothetical protein
VERAAADDVALADLPSTSGAHWANRDNDPAHREAAGRSAPFRRPAALNSFPEDDPESLSPSAYLPDDATGVPATSWFAGPGAEDDTGLQDTASRDVRAFEIAGRDTDLDGTWPQAPGRLAPSPVAAEPKAPEYGPAPPSSPGRISFGVTAGPISPNHSQSAVAPTSPAVGHPVHEARPGREGRPNRREAHLPAEDEDSGIGQLGPGREIRPHRASRRDHHRDTGAHDQIRDTGHLRDTGAHQQIPPRGPSPESAAAPPRRSRALVVATVALSAVVLLGGAVAGVAFFSGDDQSLTSVLQLGAGDTAKGKTATAPLGGRRTAAFELVAATGKANVKTADLGEDLYRITAAGDSGAVPSAAVSKNQVKLQLTPDGDGATGDVDVLLSSKVRWSLRFTGGADEQVVDLSGGQVAGIDVIGGSRRFELSLPKATGTVPVHVTGAIEDLSIQSPQGSPVRVQMQGGAKTVAAGKVTLRDVKPGSTLTPKDWKVANRYDVDAAAWLTLLSVDSAG